MANSDSYKCSYCEKVTPTDRCTFAIVYDRDTVVRPVVLCMACFLERVSTTVIAKLVTKEIDNG